MHSFGACRPQRVVLLVAFLCAVLLPVVAGLPTSSATAVDVLASPLQSPPPSKIYAECLRKNCTTPTDLNAPPYVRCPFPPPSARRPVPPRAPECSPTDRNCRPTVFGNCTRPGLFALTFDDGPSEHTLEYLGVLAEYQVKATFFVVGTQVQEQPALVVEVEKRGHQLGIHGWDHTSFRKLTADEMAVQLLQTESQLQQAGVRTKATYFRFPYGEYTPEALELIRARGYRVIEWNLDTNDWKARKSEKIHRTFRKALDHSCPTQHSFILLAHDLFPYTLQTLHAIIQQARQKGYRFVSMDECLQQV